jgi:hypothetical protein
MITFVYVTYRSNSLLDWFVASLHREVSRLGVDPASFDLVIVDARLWYDDEASRRATVAAAVADRFAFQHVPPKPCAVQGPSRLTSKDYFSAANARNSGIALVTQPYVMLVDDLSVMMPGSLTFLLQAAKEERIVACAYRKVRDLQEDGTARIEAAGIDSRWNLGKDGEFVPIHGTQVYGYLAAPLEAILQVNAFDELCNCTGMEDVQMGWRLSKAAHTIFYCRNILFHESEDHAPIGFDVGAARRRGAPMTKVHYYDVLKRLGISKRWHEGKDNNYFNDWIILDSLCAPGFWTLGNDYIMRDVHAKRATFPSTFDRNTRTLDGVLLTNL